MTTSDETLGIAIPACILSFISMVSAAYICISVRTLRQIRERRTATMLELEICSQTDSHAFFERPDLLIHHIFWMSLFDSLESLWILIHWFLKLFNTNFVESNDQICYAFGVVGQITGLGCIMWYFIIALSLFITIFDFCNQLSFKQLKITHSIIAWIVIIIMTIIPAIGKVYGLIDEDTQAIVDSSECWISDERYWITYYAPMMFVWCFAVFLLFCVCFRFGSNGKISSQCKTCINKCKFRHCTCNNNDNTNNNNNNNSDHESNINSYILGDGISTNNSAVIKRLTLFTVVYIVSWSFAMIHRTYDILSKNEHKDAPILIIGLHWCCLACLGSGNAFVWSNAHFFQWFHQLYMHMHKTKENANNQNSNEMTWDSLSRYQHSF